MKKQYSNKEIYDNYQLLIKIFNSPESALILPLKVNFYLQKNIKNFKGLAEELEQMRIAIGQKYGEYDEKEQCYNINNQNDIIKAKNELNNLMELDQLIDIYMVSFEDLENTQLTTLQMQALLFMIEEPSK